MEQNKPLKYQGYAIVCQEVPDEISLAINISGCPYHCKGCHSKYLWEYKGELLGQDLDKILSEIHDLITCVCFMGGDQNITELFNICNHIKHKYNLKICIYTGNDDIYPFNELLEYHLIDYLKTGHYDEKFGGLNNPLTNQHMYKIDYSLSTPQIEDLTFKFWRKNDNFL